VADNAPYELVIRDDGRSKRGFPAGPSGNTFIGSIFERPADQMRALVYIRAGRYNKFIDCSFSATYVKSRFEGVVLTTEDRDSGCATCETRHNRFLGSDYSGTSGHTTAFRATASERMKGSVLAQVDGMFLENHALGFHVGEYAKIEVGPSMEYNNVRALVDAEQPDVALRSGDFRFKARFRRSKQGEAALGVNVHGDHRDRLVVESSGALRWSDGERPSDAALARVRLPSGDVAMQASVPIAIQGDAAIYSGSGSPEGVVRAARGSLYLRLDGTTGSTMYVKERGVDATGWVAK
jgi:hypothetical protein